MARKGREPLTEAPPPAASSSDDEDDSSSSEGEEENSDNHQQQQQQQNQQNHSSSEGEEDEDEEDDDDDDEEEEEEEDQQQQQQQQQQQNTPSTPPPTKKILLQKKPDPPNSGSDTETDSDSPPAKIKPIASKPIKPDTQPKKPRSLSKPTVTALSAPSTKRPANDTDKGSAKKPKKDKNETSGSAQDEGKKHLFQRLWSEDDEIVILKGMIDYKAKKGFDPLSDADDFLDFIKKSLHVVDVKKDQMVNKIRRLKKKYQNAKKKKITNPHELNSFELSKKIWGDEDGVEENHDNLTLKASTVKGRASGSNPKAGGGKGVNGPALDVVKKLEDGIKKNKDDEGANREVSQRESAIQLGDLCKIGCVDEGFMKEGVKLLGEKERVELEEEWRKINVAHMEGLLQRLELYRETTRRVLNAIKSAKH